ncbi:hypothetical protein D3C86_1440820 [compost metagenome]
MLVVRHAVPVGEVAAGALRAAFDDMPGQGGLGQAVVIAPGPVELVHQGGADHRAVDHPPGDHDIRAQSQGGGNARRAQVGVHRDAERRQRGATEHFHHAGLSQFAELGLQVVAVQYGDFQLHAGLFAGRRQSRGAGTGVDPAGIADHADVLLRDVR